MTPEQIAAIRIEDVVCVYSGRPKADGNHCRCGCCGEYRYNPLNPIVGLGKDPGRGYAITDPKEINRVTVARILDAVKKHVAAGNDFSTDNETFVDIELETGRCYTVYLK